MFTHIDPIRKLLRSASADFALPCGMILLAPAPLHPSPSCVQHVACPEAVLPVSIERNCGFLGRGILCASATCVALGRRRQTSGQSTQLCGKADSNSNISDLSTVANFGCDDTGCTVDENFTGVLPLKEDGLQSPCDFFPVDSRVLPNSTCIFFRRDNAIISGQRELVSRNQQVLSGPLC